MHLSYVLGELIGKAVPLDYYHHYYRYHLRICIILAH
jgi:hypothetical protein